jgi:hypothetical protein
VGVDPTAVYFFEDGLHCFTGACCDAARSHADRDRRSGGLSDREFLLGLFAQFPQILD